MPTRLQQSLMRNAQLERQIQNLYNAIELFRQLAAFLHPEHLLGAVVELLLNFFQFYQVQIYLSSNEDRALLLRAASGAAGFRAIEDGFRIGFDDQASPAARALREASPQLVEDVRALSAYVAPGGSSLVRAEAALPLELRGRLIGVIVLQSAEVNRFRAEDLPFYRALSAQITALYDHARQVHEAFQQLDAAKQAGRDIARITDAIAIRELALGDSPVGVTIIDARQSDLPIIYANPAFERMTGLSAAEIIGKNAILIASAGDVNQEATRLITQAIQQKQPARATIHVGQRYIDLAMTPHFDADGALSYYVFIQTDVTDQFTSREREQLAYDLAQSLASMLDVNSLLQSAVERIAGSFALYHAHIYLLNTQENRLEVRAGLGMAGATLVQNKHAIPLKLERSLVATAAREARPVVVNDVTENPNHLPNPLLPHTRSEAAIPILLGRRVLGVLDVQDRLTGRFTEREVRTLELVANQLAVALTNANLFEQTQTALLETEIARSSAEALAQVNGDLLAAQSYEEILEVLRERVPAQDLSDALLFTIENDEMDRPRAARVVASWSSESATAIGEILSLAELPLTAAMREQPGLAQWIEDAFNDPRTAGLRDAITNTPSLAVMPLGIGSRWYGLLWFGWEQARSFSTETKSALEALATSAATALQTRALIEATRITLEEIEALHATGQELAAARNFEEILSAVVLDDLMRGAEHARLYLVEKDTVGGIQGLTIAVDIDAAPEATPIDPGSLIPRDDLSLVERWLLSQPDVTEIANTADDPHLSPELRGSLVAQGVRALKSLTLNYLGQTIGIVYVTWPEPHIFTEADSRFDRAVVSQVAAVVEDQRLLESTRRAEAETRRIQEMSVDLIGTATIDGYFVTLNPAWERTLGWPIDEIKGRAFMEFVHPDDYEQTLHTAEGFARGSSTINFVNRYRTKSGAYRWISWSAVPNLDDNAVYFVARDVTDVQGAQEREKLAHSVAYELARSLDLREVLQRTVDRIAASFGYYHAHIYILDQNSAALRVEAGLGEAGRMMYEMKHAIPLGAERSLVARAARSKEPVIVGDVAADPHHLPNPLLPRTRSEIAMPVILSGEVLGVLDVQSDRPEAFDIGAVQTLSIVANQVAITISNARLFEAQKDAAERLAEVDRLKNEFLANMSHELRTPLNSIIGYSELLLDDLGPQLDEMAQEDLRSIHASGHHLLSLINDVLDLAKIEAGRMEVHPAPVALSLLMPELVDMTRVLLKNKPTITLKVEIPDDLPLVMADVVRLRQIVWNLLSNAIKFTEAGEVRVTCQLDGDFMQVMVRDTGIGIAPEHQRSVFDRFQQADMSATRRAGGTGLGLSVTRELVRMHGGDIWLESKLGEGSSFTFTLPLAPAGAAPEPPKSTDNGSAKRSKRQSDALQNERKTS